jgi:hypothetical protein
MPSGDIADQGRRLAAKFDALAEPAIGGARCRELRAIIAGLDSANEIAALAHLATKWTLQPEAQSESMRREARASPG